MAYITLKDINKIYPNGFHAVHNFNLEIEQGEFVVFVGPSGCGKSTTLRMIAGLEDISKGEFLINGKRANEMGPRERGIAMVFQSYALYPQMTVFDNLAFGLELQGVDEDVIEKRVEKTAKILGLTDYLDRLPRALSGGQRQRVAVGRAIIRKVEIFLMDEPLSNLDAKQRVTMRSEITQIHRETGATTIYVTHDQTEAMTMADRIVVMKEGYVQQVGTPYDLYFHPVNVFVAGFIGEPPMNFVRSVVKEGAVRIGSKAFDLGPKLGDRLSEYEGREIVFGFRPEAVSLGACDNAYVMTGDVELTEMLGDNSNVYVTMKQDRVILKVDPHDTPEMDTEITFSVPYGNVYLFDGATEQVILCDGPQQESGEGTEEPLKDIEETPAYEEQAAAPAEEEPYGGFEEIPSEEELAQKAAEEAAEATEAVWEADDEAYGAGGQAEPADEYPQEPEESGDEYPQEDEEIPLAEELKDIAEAEEEPQKAQEMAEAFVDEAQALSGETKV